MISNLKVTKKLIKLARKHPKIALTSTLAFVTAIVLALSLPHGSKGQQEIGDSRPTVIIENITDTGEIKQDLPPSPLFLGTDISIDPGTTLTLEPGSGHVGTVRVSTQAELIMIDGDYALVLYNIPQEKYGYDLSHDHRRMGYVPYENIRPLASQFSETAAPYERYVCFDKATRIRIEKSDSGILTTARKGDYARVIGSVYSPEWSDEEWYIVAYGNFIGYMEGKNGKFITREEMIEIINTPNVYLRINGTNVNLRSEPTKDNKNVKKRLNKGSEAQVLDHQNGWYHVLYNGLEGYISDELTCLEEYSSKKIPNGLENLHFENSNEKTI